MSHSVTRIGHHKGKKQLRSGFTTGACAAAGARAAAEALLSGQASSQVTIRLPNQETHTFAIHRTEFCDAEPSATCVIIKDAGDDPDCTHGAEICATVILRDQPGIDIDGGKGVARVTQPGLELPVGMAAINPVPRRNITEMVEETLSARCDSSGKSWAGASVVISVPDGEVRAKQTISERLGLIGGISILGTRGTVKPYSTSAFAASVRQSIQVARANHLAQVVLTTGSRTERAAMGFWPELDPMAFIQAGDFAGVGLRGAARYGCEHVKLVAMIGKMGKLCAGHMMTHVSGRTIEFDLLADLAAEHGASPEQVRQVRAANTGRHVLELLRDDIPASYWNAQCQLTAEHASRYVKGALSLSIVLIDFDGSQLGTAEIAAIRTNRSKESS